LIRERELEGYMISRGVLYGGIAIFAAVIAWIALVPQFQIVAVRLHTVRIRWAVIGFLCVVVLVAYLKKVTHSH